MRFADLDAVTVDGFGTLLRLVSPIEALRDALREVGDGVGDDELVDGREVREGLCVEGADASHADESDAHGVSSLLDGRDYS